MAKEVHLKAIERLVIALEKIVDSVYEAGYKKGYQRGYGDKKKEKHE